MIPGCESPGEEWLMAKKTGGVSTPRPCGRPARRPLDPPTLAQQVRHVPLVVQVRGLLRSEPDKLGPGEGQLVGEVLEELPGGAVVERDRHDHRRVELVARRLDRTELDLRFHCKFS